MASSNKRNHYYKSRNTFSGSTGREWRISVQEETRAACTPGKKGDLSYSLPGGNIVVYATKDEVTETQISKNVLHEFDLDHKFAFEKEEGNPMRKTKYNVIDGDCMEAAEALIKEGMNPVVLNMASNAHVGGGYLKGAGAQEENLFRRTNLLRVLADEDDWYYPVGASSMRHPPPHTFYPLPDVSTIYSPSVFVLRGSEAKRYPWLENPYKIAFISSAAPRHPRLVPGNPSRMIPEAENIWMRKISALLWTAASHGHDSIVLSAWGCGAYANPPEHVAELFKIVLEQEWISGFFTNVTFAIFDDANAYQKHNPQGNLLPFQEVFSSLQQSSSSETSQSTISTATSSLKKLQIPGSLKKPKEKKQQQ